MRIVDDHRVVEFVAARTGGVFTPPYTTMGVEIEGEIAGGIVFNMFEGADCHMSVASEKRPWPKGFLAAVGNYLFRQLKRERVTIVTEQPTVVSIACRLGGKVEAVLRNHFGPSQDATIVGILKDEWRF